MSKQAMWERTRRALKEAGDFSLEEEVPEEVVDFFVDSYEPSIRDLTISYDSSRGMWWGELQERNLAVSGIVSRSLEEVIDWARDLQFLPVFQISILNPYKKFPRLIMGWRGKDESWYGQIREANNWKLVKTAVFPVLSDFLLWLGKKELRYKKKN